MNTPRSFRASDQFEIVMPEPFDFSLTVGQLRQKFLETARFGAGPI
jgi:hypothetical protein